MSVQRLPQAQVERVVRRSRQPTRGAIHTEQALREARIPGREVRNEMMQSARPQENGAENKRGCDATEALTQRQRQFAAVDSRSSPAVTAGVALARLPSREEAQQADGEKADRDDDLPGGEPTTGRGFTALGTRDERHGGLLG